MLQPPSSPASKQQLAFTVKECAIEALVYVQTPNFLIEGGTTSVVQF